MYFTGCVSLELYIGQDAGGPTIPMRFGRKDAEGPESVQPEGNLPGTDGPYLCLLNSEF